MFALIESTRSLELHGGWTGRLWSFAAHSALAAAAILATQQRPLPPSDGLVIHDMRWRVPATQQPTAQAPAPGTPRLPDHLLRVPETPPTIPAPGPLPPAPFDPGVTTRIDVPPGTIFPPVTGTIVSPPGGVHNVPQVDEPPERLTNPPLRYPEVLRQAGVEGTVVVEAVLDTLGTVERGSPRVVRGAHALFDAEALALVTGSHYRAARVGGRAVRVRIQVPVTFTLRR